jgi:hypothetical protein
VDRRTQRIMSLSAAVVRSLSLDACVPTLRNDFPIELKLSGDDVFFRWCGPTTRAYEYISVRYRLQASRNEVDVLSAYGNFVLNSGDVINARSGPDGTLPDVGEPIPMVTASMLIFVDFGSSSDKLDGPSSVFDLTSIADLPTGEWLNQQGMVSDSPCPRT